MKRSLNVAMALLFAGNVFAQIPDAQPPSLWVTTLNGQFVTSPTFVIQGTAFDDLALLRLRVYSGTIGTGYTTVTNVALSGRTNAWAVSVTLTQGMNYFLIRVYDAANKSQCDLRSCCNHPSCDPFYVVYYPTDIRPMPPSQKWLYQNFSVAELADPTLSDWGVDADGDGRPNYLEYAFWKNPRVADAGPFRVIPGIENFGGTNFFTMRYDQNSNATDMIFTPELTPQLPNPTWSSNTSSVTSLGPGKVRSTSPVASTSKMFGRVKVDPSFSTYPGLDDLLPALTANCQDCHSPGSPVDPSVARWLDGDVFSNLVLAQTWTEEDRPRVMPGFLDLSHLYFRVSTTNPVYRMPRMKPPLPQSAISMIRQWIEAGAPRFGTGGFKLSTSAVGGGRVGAVPDLFYYPPGGSAQLIPVAYLGWVFANWSGDATGTNHPLNVVMNTNKFITANFAPTADACALLTSNLVSWWQAEGNANDHYGNNSGTLQNGATFAAGKVGQAFSFDGVNDFVSIANTSSMDFGTGDFTIELWFKLNSLATDQTFIHKSVGNVSSDRTYFLEFNTPNILRFMVRGTSANQNDLTATASVAAGQWHHVAAVRTGNHSQLFLNGALIGTKTAGASADTGTGGTARLGNLTSNGTGVNRYLNGYLDEIDLYNRALSATEIQTIYSAGASGKCP